MFISHKSNVLQQVHEDEHQCRRLTKGLSKSNYRAWLTTITNATGDIDYSGETDYTIIEITDEDVIVRLSQLDKYCVDHKIYNVKVYSSKKASEIKGVQSHFIGDDSARAARLLAEEWTKIRTERSRLLVETDWMANSDVTLNTAWKTYRQKLRDLPTVQSSVTSYDDINWPSKPS